MKTNNTSREKVKIFFFTALFIVVIIYGLFRAYPLIAGVKIIINYPNNGDSVASTTFEISGQVLRAKEIKIQGRPITVDTQGNFTEILMADHPYTIIVIEATDKYGSKTVKTLNVTPSDI